MGKLLSTLSLLFLVILLVIAMAALTDYYNRSPNAAGQDGSFAYQQEYGSFLPVLGAPGLDSLHALGGSNFIRNTGS